MDLQQELQLQDLAGKKADPVLSTVNPLVRGIHNEGFDIEQRKSHLTIESMEFRDGGQEYDPFSDVELPAMALCSVLTISSCIYFGLYQDQLECEEESEAGEGCDHDVFSYLIGLLVLMILLVGVQYWINRKFRLTRGEGMRTSLKMMKLYYIPMLAVMIAIMVDLDALSRAPWDVLLAVVIFQVCALVGTIMTLKEINANTRYIQHKMAGMYVQRPVVSLHKHTFRVAKSNGTLEETLKEFATNYRDLSDFSALLTTDLQLLAASLSIVFFVSVLLVLYSESRVERLEYRSAVCFAQLSFIFIIQWSSGWQITSFNKCLGLIEDFHYLDSKMMVTLFSVVPDNSLMMTLLFYMLYCCYVLF
jgi:hypothetical protein